MNKSTDAPLETWRMVWRKGFVPGISDASLRALKTALEIDDPTLIQGATTTPPPLQCLQDWPVEAACAIGYCGWHGGAEGGTVGEVEEYFSKVCFEVDKAIGEPAACRWFLNWFDDTPRDEMRRELLSEVNLALEGRQALAATA